MRVVAVARDGRALRWPSKRPADALDYGIDWSARLDGDAIVGSEFKLPPGIVASSSSYSATVATAWLVAGVEGRAYLVVNRVITKAGRIMHQAVKLKIKSK